MPGDVSDPLEHNQEHGTRGSFAKPGTSKVGNEEGEGTRESVTELRIAGLLAGTHSRRRRREQKQR